MRTSFKTICARLRVTNEDRRRAGLMHNDAWWSLDCFGLSGAQARFLRARGIAAQPGYVVCLSQACTGLFRPRPRTCKGVAPVACNGEALRAAVGAWNARHGRLV